MRHEIRYENAAQLRTVAKNLEDYGAEIYHINKDRSVIGARIPQERLEEVKGLTGITLIPDPLPRP